MSSVGEDFPKQQARVRKVLGYYKELGAIGMFGAMMIEQTLLKADRAVMSGDPVEILQSYQELKDIEE